MLLRDLPEASLWMGGKGHDSNKIPALLQQGIPTCLPPRRNRNKGTLPARGCTRCAIRLRTCWPSARTGDPWQPAVTAVLTSSALPSAWGPPSSG